MINHCKLQRAHKEQLCDHPDIRQARAHETKAGKWKINSVDNLWHGNVHKERISNVEIKYLPNKRVPSSEDILLCVVYMGVYGQNKTSLESVLELSIESKSVELQLFKVWGVFFFFFSVEHFGARTGFCFWCLLTSQFHLNFLLVQCVDAKVYLHAD